ncbi:MAG: hypothetical protein ABI595_14575 [Actinomycetota bacterium]
MTEQRRSQSVLTSISAGLVIGVVEVVLAISFAALVFGGYLADFLANGIGMYLVSARWRSRSSHGGRAGAAWSAACRTRRRPSSRSSPRPRPWTRSGVSSERS